MREKPVADKNAAGFFYAQNITNGENKLKNNRLTPIGDAIKGSRKYNGLTQKGLGIQLGIAPNTADVRIAQYETEHRFASENLTKHLAEILGIHKYAISKLSIDTELEALHTFLKIDTYYGLEWIKNGDRLFFSFPKNMEEINNHLRRVYAAKLLYESGDISYDDYMFVKNSCGVMSEKSKYICPKRRNL